MNKLRKQALALIATRFLVALAVFAGGLAAAQAAASATNPVHVSGTWEASDFGSLSCAPDGSPLILRCTTTGFVSQYTGSLTGRSISNFEQIIDCKTGHILGHGTETFTGSIEGGVGSGSLTWGIHFDSAFDCLTFGVSGFSARAVVSSGTGTLAGLKGSIQFGDLTYDGELR